MNMTHIILLILMTTLYKLKFEPAMGRTDLATNHFKMKRWGSVLNSGNFNVGLEVLLLSTEFQT